MKRAICAFAISMLCNTLPCAGNLYAAATESESTPGAGLTQIQADPANGITEYKLNSNGLQVLLVERHHTPIVTVMVVYHVGSRNEAVGYTGSTHFLEHMMFRGTTEHDPLKGTGIDDILKPIGGLNNATTYYDRTNYYEIVPAQYMNICLELEADRMRNALLRESDRTSEMTVVRNELERDEDDPSRLMEVNAFAEAFMAHPYHHPVIGWRSDVENVPIERLRKFYNDFYFPNNATLVVIGDFKTTQALTEIGKYFGKVPAAPAPFPRVYTTEPPQQGQRRFIVRRGQDLPKVMLGYHIPQAVSKDTCALEVAASILGDDKRQSSRLYKALIDTSLASDCSANNYSLRDPGLFTILATAAGGTASEKLEATLRREATALANGAISEAELEKAKKSVWKHMKLDAADPTGMSSQLAEAIAVADWRWWVNFENNIKAVTKADVQKAARKYFQPNNETVGYYYPVHKPPANQPAGPEPMPGPQGLLDVPAVVATAQPDAVTAAAPPDAVTTAAAQVGRSTESAGNKSDNTSKDDTVQVTPTHATIASQVHKKVLPNGLTILCLSVPGNGVVSIAGKIRAGDYFAPRSSPGLPDLVADMLNDGSVHFTKDQLAQQLELMGSGLDFTSGNFQVEFESDIVTEDAPAYLALVADVLQNPSFSKPELEKTKKQTMADIQASMADTSQVASNAFYGAVYKPGCVYYQRPFKQQLADLAKIDTEQLKAFHRAHYSPANTVVAVVGDVEAATAFRWVEKALSGWHGGPAAKIDVSNCGAYTSAGRCIDNPLDDKTNVDVLMGAPAAVAITSPDFYAASIANAALGHDTISSRLAELRNKDGLTYSISSFFSENAEPNGAWVVDFTVNPTNLPKALPIVNEIMANYQHTGISAEELSNEANRLSGEYIVERMRTPHQLADALTKYEMLGLGARFMDDFPQRLKSVTVEEADAAIHKYFDPRKLVTSVAGTIAAKKVNAP